MRPDIERRAETFVRDRKVEWGMILGNIIASFTLAAILWVGNSIIDLKDGFRQMTGVQQLLAAHQVQEDKELDDHEMRIRAITDLDQGRNEIVRKLDARKGK